MAWFPGRELRMSSERVAGAACVLGRFVEANGRQDTVEMMKCLTRRTLEAGGFSGPTPATVEFRMGTGGEEGERVVIPMSVVAAGEGSDGSVLDEMRCMMVEEDGEWKFDLLATMAPKMEAMEATMRAAMGQLGDVMGEALGAVGEAMGAAFGGSASGLRSAFGDEELVPSTWDGASEVPGESEWRNLPTMTALPGLTKAVTEAVAGAIGREIPVACDLTSLLGLFNAEDDGRLVPWLDADFCPGMASAVELATRVVPVAAGRLRSIRIEASSEWMERELLLDGPDLVYRVDLRNTDGWYGGDELAERVPGVLAGLPERWEEYPRDRGVLPGKEGGATVELYRDVVAPRLMRRLSAMVGAPLALDVEWDRVVRDDRGIALLWTWGLARVVGAVGLAFPEGSGERAPEGWLRVVRLGFGYGERRAACVDGVLDMVISPYQGEKGCFSEQELCGVMFGESIGDSEGHGSGGSSEGEPGGECDGGAQG